jgi:hypothetical protein
MENVGKHSFAYSYSVANNVPYQLLRCPHTHYFRFLQLFVGRLMFYLRYLCLLVYSGV